MADATDRPAPPGFKPGDNANSDVARRQYAEAGHDFDEIQRGDAPQTFADGTVAPGTAPSDDVREGVAPTDKEQKAALTDEAKADLKAQADEAKAEAKK